MADDARLKEVAAEFARQADAFEAHAVKADVKVEERFRNALGPAGRGRVLDVACGPGVVTAAVAQDASAVVGLDATEAMLEKARGRGRAAGLDNASFQIGDAESLPFGDGEFDGVVTRLSLHHFQNPGRAVQEMARVLKPGGRAVVVDVVADEDPPKAELHNAIEILRDPTHVRMLPPSEFNGLIAAAGLKPIAVQTWDAPRRFNEWMGIVNEATRAAPLRTVVKALATAGLDAGIGLAAEGDDVAFFHRWRLVAAEKPGG